jgi:hypothetical protein
MRGYERKRKAGGGEEKRKRDGKKPGTINKAA